MTPDSRLLRQFSDAPWLIVAGTLGFLIEGGLVLAGLSGFPSWLWFLTKVMLAYGGLLGFIGFSARRTWLGAAAGLVAGATVFVAARALHLQRFGAVPGLPFRSIGWLQPIVWAVLPMVVDRIVDPWLLRGPIRTLVSSHPRFAHLRR